MTSSPRSVTSSRGKTRLLDAVKRIYAEYEHRELSTGKIHSYSDTLYQLWVRPQPSSTTITRNDEGYRVVDFLEQLIVDGRIQDHFLMLIINTLAKNRTFFSSLLLDHERFKQLFALSIRKPIDLMRYIGLLYYQCPSDLISTAGFGFYRSVVDNYLTDYIRRTQCELDWLALCSTLLCRFYENSMKIQLTTSETSEMMFTNSKDAFDFSICTINILLHYPINLKAFNDLIHDIKSIDTITKVLALVWEQDHQQKSRPQGDSNIIYTRQISDSMRTVQHRAIEHLYSEMSNSKYISTHRCLRPGNSKTTFSPAILALFPQIQLDAAESTLKTMFADGRLDGERLSILIKRLIELIDAPVQFTQHMPFETWVTGLCMALITFNQHESILKIIDETVSFLIEHLFAEQTRENAFLILFWFVRYDKRSKTFQLILDRLPALFEQWERDNNDLQPKVIEMCHMAAAIHPELNVANDSILKRLTRGLPQPDLNILSSHKNVHTKFHSIPADRELHVNENTSANNRMNDPTTTVENVANRVGLINLGNTCYVNSVLQALYQCDLFRKFILEHRFHEQPILRELQIIFAQLNLSKRPYITVANLVKIARPAWFTTSEQQDCVEFLGYLLDTIKNEEKKVKNNNQILSSSETERIFAIRTSQINRCLRCASESRREESTDYLFLPIPSSTTIDNHNQNSNLNHSAAPISSSFVLPKTGRESIPKMKAHRQSRNGNSTSEEMARLVAATLTTSNRTLNSKPPSNTSVRSRSPPPPYTNSPNPTTTVNNRLSLHQALNSAYTDIPPLSLQYVFDCYFQKEELKGDNQYRCEHCRSLQDAERLTVLQTAPEYLILSLNRFEYDKQTNVFRKIFTKMTYPKVLNVHICSQTSHTTDSNRISIKYCLVLIIVHTGYTLHGGHYYVYAREVKPIAANHSSTIDTEQQEDYFSNDEWFLLNDDVVSMSSYESLIENCAQYTSATPYVLFYKRIDTQPIEEMDKIRQICVHDSLVEQIHDDNLVYEREQEK